MSYGDCWDEGPDLAAERYQTDADWLRERAHARKCTYEKHLACFELECLGVRFDDKKRWILTCKKSCWYDEVSADVARSYQEARERWLLEALPRRFSPRGHPLCPVASCARAPGHRGEHGARLEIDRCSVCGASAAPGPDRRCAKHPVPRDPPATARQELHAGDIEQGVGRATPARPFADLSGWEIRTSSSGARHGSKAVRPHCMRVFCRNPVENKGDSCAKCAPCHRLFCRQPIDPDHGTLCERHADRAERRWTWGLFVLVRS